MEKYIYELTLKVRDYECDLQGIVNNANYQHYLEHTRHEFLSSVGVSFAKLHVLHPFPLPVLFPTQALLPFLLPGLPEKDHTAVPARCLSAWHS